MRDLLDLAVSRDLTRDAGLSEADYDVLSNLSESPDQRQRLNDLAARMLWSKSRLSHHLSRMRQRGLISREDCPSDARGTVISLTGQGLAAITGAAPGHVESVRRNFVDLLTPAQVDALAELTHTVIEHLSEQN
jgi:DNA-binding MarR family transcriptional regulator